MMGSPSVDIQVLPNLMHNCRIKTFPDGSSDILVSDRAIFREPDWEFSDDRALEREKQDKLLMQVLDAAEDIDACELNDSSLWRWLSRVENKQADNLARAKRRARAAVRDIALANDFRWFVTLTLDREKVDRYDIKAVTKKLNNWLDNSVRRHGLMYVLVAETHHDGAIHFHGFFNDAVRAVDSGTVSLAGSKKPRRPRSARQRAEWIEQGGHVVYNLPGWTLGFTTAIELYGERRAAVGYVCKYISKAQEKIGGRWYYSGGALRRPVVSFANVKFEDFLAFHGAIQFTVEPLGAKCLKLTTEGGVGSG